MSLYDVIAAGHRGQCFGLMARRFMISEPQAAQAVRLLIPALLPPFEAWISSPDGLRSFLDLMSRGGYENSLRSATVLNNHFERDRGMQLLDAFRAAQEIDGADLARAVEGSGLSYRVLTQMLPFVVLFLMGSLRLRAEAPLRDVLAKRLGPSMSRSSDPFADLADLMAWEAKGHRPGLLATVIDSIFSRRTDSSERQSQLA